MKSTHNLLLVTYSFASLMLNRIKTLASLYRDLGLHWSAFRLAYAFRLCSGLIRLQTPQYAWADRPLKHWLKPNIPSAPNAYAAWRKTNAPAFFPNVGAGSPRSDYGTNAIEEANKLLSGELKYFSHTYHQVGFPPNWHQIPSMLKPPSSAAGKVPNMGTPPERIKHWSQISDDRVIARRADGRVAKRIETQPDEAISNYDIKFIWEPNRFAFAYTLVRAYAATGDEKYPQAFWRLIQDWAEHNPPNSGANWKDGQEIALRLMAWTFGFYAFIHSPSTTPENISHFSQLLAAQAERIHANLAYAISTRSNHTISEAFGLWMVGLLFPELKHAEKYLAIGKKLLEAEAAKQIFPDGSYAMYSLNYHRFILHLYLYAIRLADINHSPFSKALQQSISNSITYLSRLIDPTTGHMPIYGSNDGALVLPLNNCGFTDYRPLLQLGSVITTGKPIFDLGDWDEDVFWLYGNPAGRVAAERHIETSKLDAFPHGGLYILRNTNSRAILRCTDFTSRPSHADQLHMDLWMGNHNIACDAGTYLYSGAGIWRNGFARTSAHNTVTVDNKDQMTLISRFTWTDWAKGRVLKHTDNLWQGEHDGYKPVRHKRTVMALEGDRWLVVDELNDTKPHHYTLHWLLNDVPLTENKYSIHLNYESSIYKVQTGLTNGEGEFSILRADPASTRGWRSRFYGHKEPAISLLLEANRLAARFYTFFGFEDDSVEQNRNILSVNGREIILTATGE